ncbi:MAG: glycoside hydrolase family 3 domain protein [Frondihabitans sp.]|nr:glycoside hydrolase family 3 domain protein [Frondihabitans sp.]
MTTDYLNPNLDVGHRVADLLGRMTLREKCFQLVSVPAWYVVAPDGSAPEGRDDWLERSPGHISNFALDDPASMADFVGRLQKTTIDGTRLGIPLLIHAEALNGFMCGGHMVFPTPTGLAATWSPNLVEDMTTLIGQQMRRVGVRQALSPNMDIALDPRWGRTHETYGEDPYLAAAMSVAFTRGIQGPDLRDGVIATAKHFVGYSAPAGGVNLSAYDGGPRRTRDLFSYPFEASIQLARLASVMNSYSDVDGAPVAASPEILTDLLRDTLGFRGFVSADYMTLEHLVTRQKAAADPAEAARLTLAAGLDVENPVPYGYGDVLAAEVESGRVPLAQVDSSVSRVLEAKFALGLFENPYPQERIDVTKVASEGAELSRELARRSVVLATNDGILPLRETPRRVVVIGPHADLVKAQFPTYTYPAFRDMTVHMSGGGLGNMVGIDPGMAGWNDTLLPATSTEQLVRTTLGATSLFDEIRKRVPEAATVQGSTLTKALDDEALDTAVCLAGGADLVILALGGSSSWFQGERTEGEASDSADIALPEPQRRLAEAVAQTGAPIVTVIFQGRAYALPDAVLQSRAVIIAPYGGPFGPAAVVDVLFGDANPSGKLPYSIPLHSGQIPIYHHQHSGTGARNPLPPSVDELYLDMSARPLFPFGHGLSYTSFHLEQVASHADVGTFGAWPVWSTVVNTGDHAGAAVVQLYLSLTGHGITRPAQQLAGFARVHLEPGESRRIRITVDAAQLGYTALDQKFVVEPGTVGWKLGLDSDSALASGEFIITGKRRTLESAERSFLSSTETALPINKAARA